MDGLSQCAKDSYWVSFVQFSIFVAADELLETPEAMAGKSVVEFHAYPKISNYSPLRHFFLSFLHFHLGLSHNQIKVISKRL